MAAPAAPAAATAAPATTAAGPATRVALGRLLRLRRARSHERSAPAPTAPEVGGPRVVRPADADAFPSSGCPVQDVMVPDARAELGLQRIDPPGPALLAVEQTGWIDGILRAR